MLSHIRRIGNRIHDLFETFICFIRAYALTWPHSAGQWMLKYLSPDRDELINKLS